MSFSSDPPGPQPPITQVVVSRPGGHNNPLTELRRVKEKSASDGDRSSIEWKGESLNESQLAQLLARDQEFIRKLGAQLADLRLRANVSLETAGSHIGAGRVYLQRMEAGRIALSIGDLSRLLRLYQAEDFEYAAINSLLSALGFKSALHGAVLIRCGQFWEIPPKVAIKVWS